MIPILMNEEAERMVEGDLAKSLGEITAMQHL